ncbi:MAG: PEP-CTERM sorting domain-containing protein [Gammaproteobacteria bacterium]
MNQHILMGCCGERTGNSIFGLAVSTLGQKFVLVATLVALFAAPVQATPFDIKFWDTTPSAPGTPPATNIADATLVTTGTMTINDSAIAPGAFVTFESGDITQFLVEYNDRDGNPLSFDYHTDITSYFDDADFGVLFDSAGEFLRFDSPLFTFSNSTVLVDDENPNPTSGFFAAFLTIFDDDDLSYGYLLEDATFGGVSYSAGDFVDPTLFPTYNVALFPNAWDSTGAVQITGPRQFEGFIEVIERPGSPQAIPVPPTLPLLGIGLFGFGLSARRRKMH